jgi:L-iditol 2-dehydrogenase
MIPKTMKASQLIAYNRIEMREIPVPEPGPGEVLCKIKAIAICGSDPEIINGHHAKKGWPPQFPFTAGHEWSGEVVALGPGATGFAVGDRVAGEAHKGCGICANCLKGRYTLCLNYGKPETGHRHYGMSSPGANCEYNAFSTKSIHKIQGNLSYAHATLLDTAGVALHGIEMTGVTPGGTVAIWGPGPIGLCALQIMKGMGAKTVIMVGRGHRLRTAGEIGADVLVDYEKEDPAKRILEITEGIGADEIQETSGSNLALDQCIASIRKGGKINSIAFYKDSEVKAPPYTQLVMNEITLSGSRANPNVSAKVLGMFSAGIIKGDKIVTHTFPLERYVEALDIFANKKDGAIKVVILPEATTGGKL